MVMVFFQKCLTYCPVLHVYCVGGWEGEGEGEREEGGGRESSVCLSEMVITFKMDSTFQRLSWERFKPTLVTHPVVPLDVPPGWHLLRGSLLVSYCLSIYIRLSIQRVGTLFG